LLSKTIFAFLILTFSLNITSVYAESKKKKTEPSGNQELLLETLGTVSVQGLYLSYMAMGSLSDGFVVQSYDTETTKIVMTTYINLASTCKDQLSKLTLDGNLSKEDKKILKEIEVSYGYLIAQGNALLNYIQSGSEEELTKFEFNRKQAGNKIDQLINAK